MLTNYWLDRGGNFRRYSHICFLFWTSLLWIGRERIPPCSGFCCIRITRGKSTKEGWNGYAKSRIVDVSRGNSHIYRGKFYQLAIFFGGKFYFGKLIVIFREKTTRVCVCVWWWEGWKSTLWQSNHSLRSWSDRIDKLLRSELFSLAPISLAYVVVVVLLFYVHGKHLRSFRDGQLT